MNSFMNSYVDDPLFVPAIEWVIANQKVSVSGLQRNFRIGYNMASQIVELMENIGVVSPQGFEGNRTVLCPEIEDAYSLLQDLIENSDVEPDMTNVILFSRKK